MAENEEGVNLAHSQLKKIDSKTEKNLIKIVDFALERYANPGCPEILNRQGNFETTNSRQKKGRRFESHQRILNVVSSIGKTPEDGSFVTVRCDGAGVEACRYCPVKNRIKFSNQI